MVRVLDAGGAPVAGAKVLLAARGWGELENYTDSMGYAYFVVGGYDREVGIIVYYLSRRVASASMSPPETSVNVTADVYRPAVRVLDGKGRPIGEAVVQLSFKSIMEEHTFTATTGANGYAYFRQLPGGPYNMTVSDVWGVLQRSTFNLTQSTYNVSVQANAYTLRIRVLDEEGRPAGGASVAVTQGRKTFRAQTSYTGEISVPGLPPGRYKIYVNYHFKVKSAEVTIANDDVELTFSYATQTTTHTTTTATTQPGTTTTPPQQTTTFTTVPPGKSLLSIVVRWSDGRRAVDAPINIYRDGWLVANLTADINGRAKTVLDNGVYIVKTGLYGATAQATVTLTGNTEVKLVLNAKKAKFPTYTLTVKAQWSDGTPIKHETIVVKDVDTGRTWQAILNDRGEATFILSPGVYTVTVQLERTGQRVTDTLAITRNTHHTITLGANPVGQLIPLVLLAIAVTGIASSTALATIHVIRSRKITLRK